MDYVFDIIMVAVFALSIFIGYKRGLVATAFSVLSVVIAIVVANMLSPYVTDALAKTGIDESIAKSAATRIEMIYDEEVEEEIQKSCEEIITDMHLPAGVAKFISTAVGNLDDSEAFAAKVEKISYAVASMALRIIAYVLVVILVSVALILVGFAIKIVRIIPVVKTLDSWGGSIAGGVLGLFIVFVVCLIVYAGAMLFNNSFAGGVMSDSVIISLIDKAGIFSAIL